MTEPADRCPRLLSEKCSTCIFRPGNPMNLAHGRVAHMVRDSIASGGAITCHNTLPYGPHPDADEATCRGFYDAVGERTNIVRIVHRLGGYREVPPPAGRVQAGPMSPPTYAGTRSLSRAYSIGIYRGSKRDLPRYSPIGGRNDCDECYARQHESAGQLTEGGGTRARAKTRRDFPTDGPETALLLCRDHEHLWRERDTVDGVPARRP